MGITPNLGLPLFGNYGWREDGSDGAQLDKISKLIDAAFGALEPNVPIIQARNQGINVTSTAGTTVSLTAAETVMYAISVSLETTGTAATGHTVVATLSWTSPIQSHSATLTLHLDGGPVLVVETFPVLCQASTPISVMFAYGGGATADPFTYAVRIVQMP